MREREVCAWRARAVQCGGLETCTDCGLASADVVVECRRLAWEEARIAIWGWALVAPIETEGRDWACQCDGLGTAIQGCGLEAFGMERTRQRLNYEKLLAVRDHPAARNEPQSDLSTARPLSVRLEGASLALARARTAHWWARHRLCIQGFVGLVG